MSIAHLEAEIRRFLSNSEPEVLCIKGPWGVGKTYAWNHYLRKSQEDLIISLDKYSYVSLFGRNSIDDVKTSIVENSVDSRKKDASPDLVSYETSIELIDKGTKLFSRWGALLPKASGYANSASRILYIIFKNQLVCIDDLERIGNNLEAKSILGLITDLKEQKKCKVVLLLNDTMLDDGNKSDFNQQIEKTADTIITFDPAPDEAASIGVSSEFSKAELLKSCIIKLNLNNIRIIKRIERFCNISFEILRGYDDRILACPR